jgi:UDP:flavonoid glycosyltransferase YjiC (YdhE family)
MRVLFSTQPLSSHWHQLVPLARALESAGHEVAFASTPGFCPSIEATGFRSYRAGADETEEEAKQIREQIGKAEGRATTVPVLKYVFWGIRADRMLPDMLAIINDWHPQVVVREHSELAGCVAAERAGIPHATYQLSAPVPWFMHTVEEPLNRLLASVGLPPGTPGKPADMLYRYLLLYPRPSSLWNPEVSVPATKHAFRYIGFNQSGEEALPEWIAELGEREERPEAPVKRRPTVYATLGTAWNVRTDILSAILEGLREEPINLILTVGRNRDPMEFGEQPAHVHIERYIPQTMLLPHCDLVVTHGGSGTVLDALSLGLPMVIIPIAADQPVNAQRCAELGVARIVTPEGRTEHELAQEIREATRALVHDPAYRERAQRLQKEMEALPGLEYPVALLETLATQGLPLRAHLHAS